jgi:uncharacterized oligopeptide transporter (OPT) family protein
MVLAESGTGYPFLDLMWTMLVFFGWVIWFWMIIVIFGDIFRRTDISGWGKAGWTVFVIVVPFIGVLTYLITQGRRIAERKREQQEAAQEQFSDYVRSVAPQGNGAADQIVKAKRLLDDGAINEAEFQTLKQQAMSR